MEIKTIPQKYIPKTKILFLDMIRSITTLKMLATYTDIKKDEIYWEQPLNSLMDDFIDQVNKQKKAEKLFSNLKRDWPLRTEEIKELIDEIKKDYTLEKPSPLLGQIDLVDVNLMPEKTRKKFEVYTLQEPCILEIDKSYSEMFNYLKEIGCVRKYREDIGNYYHVYLI